MLRLAQQRASYVCTNAAIYRVVESDFAFSTREIFLRERKYIHLDFSEGLHKILREDIDDRLKVPIFFKNLFSSKFYHAHTHTRATKLHIRKYKLYDYICIIISRYFSP